MSTIYLSCSSIDSNKNIITNKYKIAIVTGAVNKSMCYSEKKTGGCDLGMSDKMSLRK